MQLHDMIDHSPDAIAARLECERADLAKSISGLRNRLTTDALVGDALDYAREQVAPYARALDRAVRANPMAAVMTGVGLAWLILGRKGSAAPEVSLARTKFEALARWEDEGGPVDPDPGADAVWIAEADVLRHRASDALARIEDAARRQLQPAANLALDRARVVADLARATRVAMLRGLDTMTQEVQGRTFALREEAYAARLAAHRQAAKLIEEYPLVAGAIGMAIGAAVASSLPPTHIENRVFGPERDRMVSRAQDALRRERARAAGTMSRLAENVAAEVRDSTRELVLDV